MSRKRLGDLLVESGLITEQQLETTLRRKSPEEKLGDALLQEGHITEQQLAETLERQLGIPRINLYQYPMDPEVIQLIPRDLAKRHQVMPIRKENHKLFVAMADPMDYFAIEELRMATGYQIIPALATKEELQRTISKHYDLQESLDEALSGYTVEETLDETGITDEDSPVVRLVNQIINHAVTQRASDIHFDPMETELKVRYRIDGILRTERSLPKHMQNVIIARIKIMGNLNITESRVPQDGRIKMNVNFKPVDIRLSTLPSVYGEKIVMRILDLSNALGDLENLGFAEDNLHKFIDMIEKPNGIVLITGPTGSGKSSTLYAALNRLNSEEVNIITIEDPVEYQLDGVNQVQVNEDIGMTFASGLRSILRQDPDIIMIGEIRDLETAQISIRSSLTGHLVLSTLHTNSAVAALTRLIDMGIEPFLISSSLTGVVAQRLVRRVCRDCSEVLPPTEREKEIFQASGLEINYIHKGRGCPSCTMTGYRGRIAIHEVLTLDNHIRELIMNAESSFKIRQYVQESGMKFLLADGLLKVAEGLTTTEEVLRVAAME
ncbi:ATPase, T2SS/T4P/T4SS family [Siminovitchia fortis]|uniref:Type II secretion system protein GspE n=1 Tax=Siminovitchia fortis TaxID=254758 RepID=A0A443IUV1_9BACI|nr:ATPase, T2SS/T4P/T4SS family [Siminovitchia fortis]RWR11851.1 type II secretion system protein GspE [Siminovitchia fortis]WHY81869.1 ATPase, T2SS/T4P/T4SS family [Siminovitchia fortis]